MSEISDDALAFLSWQWRVCKAYRPQDESLKWVFTFEKDTVLLSLTMIGHEDLNPLIEHKLIESFQKDNRYRITEKGLKVAESYDTMRDI